MWVISNNIFCAGKLFEMRVTPLNTREFKYMWEKCEEHLEILFTEKLGIEEIILIERAHMTKLVPEARRRKPTTTLCTLHSIRTKLKSCKCKETKLYQHLYWQRFWSKNFLSGKNYGKTWNSCEVRVK